MRKKHFTISNFVCPDCGMIVPLPRIHGQQRERGHVKTFWCPGCKADKDFVEVRYKECYVGNGRVIY